MASINNYNPADKPSSVKFKIDVLTYRYFVISNKTQIKHVLFLNIENNKK